MSRSISQREARHMRKELRLLQERDRRRASNWGTDWPGGANFLTLQLVPVDAGKAQTAQLLGHAMVGRVSSDGRLYLYAVKP